jgi:hypothetical protein
VFSSSLLQTVSRRVAVLRTMVAATLNLGLVLTGLGLKVVHLVTAERQ